MATLPLTRIEIDRYRPLRHLALPRLGRLNLLTGKNNVGKTAILEALRIAMYRGSPHILREILRTRHEWPLPTNSSEKIEATALIQALRSLFHRRPEVSEMPQFWISALGDLSFSYRVAVAPEPDREPEEASTSLGILTESRPLASSASWTSYLPLAEFENSADSNPLGVWRLAQSPPPCVYVSPSGLDERSVVVSWDEIALTPLEDRVLEALRIIAPEIDRIHPIAGANGYRRGGFRVRTRTSPEPFLLSSMGDGINRILGLSIALASARGGLLLLDEVENGIHYSVQPEIWRHIFRVAKQLDVQVFATTHSYDAVRAFQQAAAEHPEEGVLIRLNRQGDEVTATTFDEADLEVVAEEEIEVR